MRTLLAAILATLLAAAGASAAPSGLSADPLDRGALLALPSVYRLQTIIHVDGVRTADGRRLMLPPKDREITEIGTATAVTSQGWLVTAAHVGAPDAAAITRLAYQQWRASRGETPDADDARAWVEENDASPVNPDVVRRTATPAQVQESMAGVRGYPVLEVRRATDGADLALLRIGLPAAPALTLNEAASTGTPIATIGFGRKGMIDDTAPANILEPSIRTGRIIRTGTLDPDTADARQAIAISADVELGDSGGPVVDSDGALRGIVTQKARTYGVAERSTEVRRLLSENDLVPDEGPAAQAFRAAMASLWSLDLAAAQSGLDATLRAFPGHAVATHERARVRELAAAPFALRGRDRGHGALLAVAVIALAGAAGCALALAWPALRRPRGSHGGQ